LRDGEQNGLAPDLLFRRDAMKVPHVIGSLTLNQHCTFIWREFNLGEVGSLREVEIQDHHCERCIRDVLRLGMRVHDLREVRVAG
jgi:hypothetical protein